jgi:hypothetical protein
MTKAKGPVARAWNLEAKQDLPNKTCLAGDRGG